MARPKSPPALLHGPEYVGATPSDIAAEEATVTRAEALADEMTNDTFDLGIAVGRLEAMDFIARFSNSSMILLFENVKKSKAWRNLKDCDGRNFSTLGEFCQAKFDLSYRRLQELVSNRDAIGQEAFAQAETLGLRQMDYNLLKSLPQPKQEIIKNALVDGATREELQKALRELAAVDQQEISKLEKGLSEAEENNAALSKNLAEKKADLDSLRVEFNQARRRIHAMTADESCAELRAEFARLISTAEVSIRSLKMGCEALIAHTVETGIAHDDFLAGSFDQIDTALTDLRFAYNIKDHPGETFDYVRPEVADAIALAAERKQQKAASVANIETE